MLYYSFTNHPVVTDDMRAFARFLLLLLVFVTVSLSILRLDFGESGFHIVGDDGVAEIAAGGIAGREPMPEAGAKGDAELGRLNVVSRVIGYVRNRYVDSARVKPRKMFIGSVERLQRRVTEIMVREEFGEVPPGASKDDKAEPRAVIVTAGSVSRRFELEKIEDLYTLNWALVDLFGFLREALPAESLGDDAEFAAAAGMVRELDPHSTMMNPEQYADMKVGTYGKFGGLGIVVSVRKAKLRVMSVIAGTPADRAGLKGRDHIVQIGDESTINMGIDEAVSLMRGDPDTRVTIWILRKGWKEPRAFPITRAIIRVKSVISKRLDQDIAYVRIKNFNSNTTSGVTKALAEMSAAGELRGLVLDLRSDPGGLLSQAIRVSNLFLSEGVIVTTVGKAGTVRDEKKASAQRTRADLPIVVLVDGASASASEIVAGALKYSGRGVIVGERTFGKATVQELYEIAEGALKLTVAQYLTPGDVLIQNVGITPDVALYPVVVEKERNTLYENELESFGEADLKGTIENEGARVGQTKPLETVKYVYKDPDAVDAHGKAKGKGKDSEEPVEREYDAVVEDFPIRFTRDLLVAAGDADAGRFLERARGYLRRVGAEQEAGIVSGLATQAIAWQAGEIAAAPPLVAELSARRAEPVDDSPGGEKKAGEVAPVLDIAPDAPIRGGDDVVLTLRVTNNGATPVSRLHALLDADWDLLDGREIIVGRVPPGETREGSARFEIPRKITTRLERVTARLFQDYEAIEAPKPQEDLTFQATARPDFALLVLPSGKASPLLYEDQDLSFGVRVMNTGGAVAEKLTITLKNKSGDRVLLKKGRFTAENVAPGEVAEAKFEVHLNDTSYGEDLEFVIGAYDSISRRYASVPFVLPVPSETIPIEAAAGYVRLERDALVRVLPDAGSAVAGVLAQGSVLRRVASAGALVSLDLEEDGFKGWLREDEVAPFERARETAYRFTPRFPFSPPELSLDAAPPLIVTTPRLRFRGSVLFRCSFLTKVGDIFAFRNDDKVFFQRVDLDPDVPSEAPFDFAVDLEPGYNRVRVTGRAGTKVRRSETWYVYYDASESPGDAPRNAAADDASRPHDNLRRK